MSASGRRPPPPLLILSLLAAIPAACGGDGSSSVRSPGAEDTSHDATVARDPGGRTTADRDPAAPSDAPATLVDAEGRTVSLAAPPTRIVSLVPSANQVLLELGAGPRLVGRTEHDTLSALAELPSVGGGLHPSLEVLVALEPDLVIRFAGESDRATPARLDQAGVAHLAVAPESLADIRGMIGMLGTIADRAAAADSLVRSIDEALAGIRARVDGLPPVRAAWVMAGSPPWVAGPGSFVDELITLAGGVNVYGDLDRPWAAVSPESLVGRAPDVLLTPEGTRLDSRITAEIPVRTVSPVVQLPGSHVARAAREIAGALHPGLFR